MYPWYVEAIGYAGMAIVILSFAMRNIIALRIVNFVGSALCLAYGILTHTFATAALNGALMVINLTALTIIEIRHRRNKGGSQK